jgi:hypothetical protein
MVNIQQEVNALYLTAVQRISEDLKEGKTFSFHHYAVKYGLDAHRLQKEWVKYKLFTKNTMKAIEAIGLIVAILLLSGWVNTNFDDPTIIEQTNEPNH